MECQAKTLAVYIHIPFCKTICSYCDFCKVFYHPKWAKTYLEILKQEINDRYMGEDISSLYIGGGTPSSLSYEELKKLMDIVKVFKLTESYEFTFECNLNDINNEMLAILKENGVNRLSIGIESFDENNLKFMNREANYKDAQNKIKMIKDVGIDNINVDLIYALPNQTLKLLKNDLKKFSKLDVQHISTYSLMIEKNTILGNKNIQPISEELDAKMYKKICKFLKRHRFKHYEISNFAKEGYESRHNLVYWNNAQYYGFGVGASGYIDNIRYDNTKSLTDYLKGNFVLNQEILSFEDIMDYELILGLRKCDGINIKKFHEKYGVNIQNKYPIAKLLKEKDLIYKKGNIFINPDKLYIMNEILLKLV